MPEIIADNSTAQQAIERNYRWNFIVNTLDGASFWFGMSFFSSAIIGTVSWFVLHFAVREPRKVRSST